MEEARRTYVPAAGHHWSLPLYDPIVKLLGADRARGALLDQAAVRPRQRVLDIGCGTGSLAVQIKRIHPDVEVVGVDPDPKALARARGKVERARVEIQLHRGFSDALPYPDASFDHVFSSFMFHHLAEREKEDSLREVRRVLKPGAFLHLLDFGGSDSGKDGSLVRWFHSNHRLKDNSEGRLLELMQGAGFADPKKVANRAMFLLRIAYYQASAPAAEASAA
ncbi:MAG: class I SAM-dependent methyltransferase [Vicinamibacteria bacterium]